MLGAFRAIRSRMHTHAIRTVQEGRTFFLFQDILPFFCNTIQLCPRNMILREPETWLSPGMVSIFVLSEEIEHFKVQLAMCFQNSRWRTQIPRYPKKDVLMISQ